MSFGICHSKCQRKRIEHIGLDLVTRPKGVRKSCLCVHLRMAHNILVILMRVLHACLKYFLVANFNRHVKFTHTFYRPKSGCSKLRWG